MSIGEKLAIRLEQVTEERDALAAHVEEWRWAFEQHCADYPFTDWLDWVNDQGPATSLDRLKAEIRAEVWNEINGPVQMGEPVIPNPPTCDGVKKEWDGEIWPPHIGSYLKCGPYDQAEVVAVRDGVVIGWDSESQFAGVLCRNHCRKLE